MNEKSEISKKYHIRKYKKPGRKLFSGDVIIFVVILC